MTLKALLDANRQMARRIDGVARSFGRRDGNYAFVTETLPGLLKARTRVLDVGGGKNPGIPVDVKERLELRVDGLDISASELERAPKGAYDDVIVGDVATARISERYDLIFSCAVLEHVREAPLALTNLASGLVPGGTMSHFIPNAFAPFAIANRLLGAERARRVLFTAFPSARHLQGFTAYYQDCWPSRLTRLCRENHLEVVSLEPYFSSGYASFFWPLHAVDVARQLALMGIGATDCCESFTITARRPP